MSLTTSFTHGAVCLGLKNLHRAYSWWHPKKQHTKTNSLMLLPYTCLLEYLSPWVASRAKTKVQNAPKPSQNLEKHSKTAKNIPKNQNCPKTLENAQNGQNVEILFKPSRPVALPPARRRRGCFCRSGRGQKQFSGYRYWAIEY